jgi:hypothetical protein
VQEGRKTLVYDIYNTGSRTDRGSGTGTLPVALARRWPVSLAAPIVAATLLLAVLAAAASHAATAPAAARDTLAAVAPASLAAPVSEPGPAPAGASVEQLRQDFALRGYSVEPSIAWAWLSPPVTTFRVHDPHRGRALLVQVFADDAVAQAARQHAAPMPCYASSTWVRNVAIFQSTTDSLRSCMAASPADGMGPDVDSTRIEPPLSAGGSPVDQEYVGLVVNPPSTVQL